MSDDRKLQKALLALDNLSKAYKVEASEELAIEIILAWVKATLEKKQARFIESFLNSLTIAELRKLQDSFIKVNDNEVTKKVAEVDKKEKDKPRKSRTSSK